MTRTRSLFATAVLILMASLAFAQDDHGVDPQALIDQILQVDKIQRDKIKDLTLDAVLTDGKRDRDSLIEKSRFYKKIYIKQTEDRAWFFEEYLEFYENGEKQSSKELAKAAKEKKEKKQKRQSMDISYFFLTPFTPAQRPFYNIDYKGITEDVIEGYICHHFRVDAIEKNQNRLNSNFYFEVDGFHLVRVEFTPSKQTSNLMFKMKKLDMSLTYQSYPDGNWLPREFNIDGKGKIAFLFGVTFAGREVYSNPVINSGLADEMFQDTY